MSRKHDRGTNFWWVALIVFDALLAGALGGYLLAFVQWWNR